MTTNELEALALSVAAKTGRTVEDCRTGIRYNLAALMAKYDAKKANDYLSSFGLVRLFDETSTAVRLKCS